MRQDYFKKLQSLIIQLLVFCLIYVTFWFYKGSFGRSVYFLWSCCKGKKVWLQTHSKIHLMKNFNSSVVLPIFRSWTPCFFKLDFQLHSQHFWVCVRFFSQGRTAFRCIYIRQDIQFPPETLDIIQKKQTPCKKRSRVLPLATQKCPIFSQVFLSFLYLKQKNVRRERFPILVLIFIFLSKLLAIKLNFKRHS